MKVRPLVIAEINDHYGGEKDKFYGDIEQPVFLAHSKSDQSARYEGAYRLYSQHPNEAKEIFTIEMLPHASVVLDQAIRKDPNAVANPQFEEMTGKMLEFTAKHVVGR